MRTIYIKKSQLQKDLDSALTDFFTRNAAEYALKTYPECEWFIYDPFNDSFKPSKRK